MTERRTAISTVMIGMWSGDGTPVPMMESAICAVCGAWATNVWSAGESNGDSSDMTHIRTSRRLTVVAYACPEHSEVVGDQLCGEYGSASSYQRDELAEKVDAIQRAPFLKGGARREGRDE